MEHNKLVRDRIPEIIAANGEEPVTRVLADVEYKQELKKKLHEEVAEFDRSGTTEELADVLEVVYALAAVENLSPTQLETLRQQKREERGGFEQRIFLIETLASEEGANTENE